jgi:hypothetical protein
LVTHASDYVLPCRPSDMGSSPHLNLPRMMVFTLSHAFKSGHVSANDVCILRHTRRGAQTRTHFALRLRELRRR